MSRNGTSPVLIRTLNGVHYFNNQRYIDKLGTSSAYLINYEGRYLSEFICYYSNRLSYRELSSLLERLIGVCPYQSRQLQNKVVSASESVGIYIKKQQHGVQLSLNFLSPVDIYDPKSKEVLYFDDGVGVKKQKEHRQKTTILGSKSSATVQTDVVVIGDKTKYDYRYRRLGRSLV